jgi:molecular chaperone DnaK
MKSAVDVDDAAVQQMVEESVEHAFEDLAARRWIEAKLKAVELVAVDAQRRGRLLGGTGGRLQTRLERALRDVETALAAEHPETKTGDTKQLQTACAALDEATRPLADLLMDKATEALLRKRGAIS